MMSLKIKSKKGVSLMISYVLLIALAIIMAGVVYTSLKLIANVKPVAACEESTSVLITKYSCGAGIFNVTFQNNGRFSVNGIVISVGDSKDRTPITPIQALMRENKGYEKGYYIFNSSLSPGNIQIAQLEPLSVSFLRLEKIRVQPFIIDKNNNTIICETAVITQNLDNCVVR
ncbi:MAG: hypothetical protein AABX16_04090 [Nanoarchaeota archaeon]